MLLSDALIVAENHDTATDGQLQHALPILRVVVLAPTLHHLPERVAAEIARRNGAAPTLTEET